MKKVLLVGASQFNDESKIYDTSYLKVAIDNGYSHFYKNKIECDYLIGDFDTLKVDDLKYAKEVIKLNPIKDDTDTFFAVKKFINEGYNTFHFIGCLGNRTDMTLSSISILKYLLENKKDGVMFSDNEEVFLADKNIKFSSTEKGKISILSLTYKTHVIISNLKYEYSGYLSNSIPLGISNEFISKASSVEISDGIVIIIKQKN